ncbi:LacI family DNA-binding transcriptional regulator [Thermocaproicibacter melissae]|uniref:LacI family DNA-binding transcriptional regulator n=1 Tax=Thermocaproicibacter melissae TaxID=2966552 RepID=UPI0024B0E6A4|nr:LacI family DNA-binding transcriptional regulator [Thermocaproicibacter melissae]WBY63678.1 LacI family DNA-binding transcriptional regulator [Thermocaproicibacter melissae]
MANIKDIAAKCGLSVSTISKALNGYTDISRETKQKVLKAAEECGYLPNSMARALKTNRTYNIGVLFADEAHSGLKQEYFAAVLDAFKVEAEKNSYDITFISHNMDMNARSITYLEHCKYRNFDGVCIACVDFQNPEVLELINSPIPVVTIDHVFNGHTSINSANVAGMNELVRYIYSMGHRKIAYVHGKKSTVTEQRLTSFCHTMKELGCPLPPEYLVLSAYHDIASTKAAVKKLLALPNRPTCIIMPDDYAALGGIEAIEAAGLRIPEDISIAGYDGIPLSQMLRPKLTTIQQDTERMGTEAAKRLIEQIENPLTTITETVTIEGHLLEGQSVKRILPD